MPPKVKKEKKKKRNPTVPLHEIDTTVLTREKLEEFCVNVHNAIRKEKEESECLRLDRDKLANMLAIATEQLTHAKDTVLTKQTELRDAEDRHRLTMWENRQKLMYLASEKNTATLNSKLESLHNINQHKSDHEQRMSSLLSDIQDLNKSLKLGEQVLSESKLKEEITHAEHKSQIREKDKENHIVKENCAEKISAIKEKELTTRFEKEYTNLEKRKNNEIAMLIKSNAKFASHLKHYYNKLVNHNLTVIDVMRADYGQLKGKTAITEKQFAQLSEENAYLVTALSSSQTEESRLNSLLAFSQQDQNKLKHLQMDLKRCQVRLQHDTICLEALNMRVAKEESLIKEEVVKRDSGMFNKRTKAEEIIVALEFMAAQLYHRDKEADATLYKIKLLCLKKGKDHEALELIPAFRNTLVDEMNYQIASVAKERQRILGAYKAILNKYNIHGDETGFAILGVDDILKPRIV